ncbi:MAG: type II toxin-antitoxin system VapC family toxin [Alphaproteobacteria bacterium]|nr:type II toxin-antitoxin system VapC family toxin [Alphaproteobacteria bacterium]
MKAVVDTNGVAYLLLGTEDFVEEARAGFAAIKTPIAPAHWEAELGNVVWMATRAGVLLVDEAPHRLALARRLGIESIAIGGLTQGALMRSIAAGVSFYDTLFVELAARTNCPLLTFDDALLKAFPAIAKRPKAIVG